MEKEHECCIVVPVYRQLVVHEYLSFQRLIGIFKNSEYANHIYIITYKDINIKQFQEIYNKTNIVYLDSSFFKNGIVGYNALMTHPEFYKTFNRYKYMLIHQLDCFMFYNNLKYFIDLDYDYYGAPIINIIEKLKNGKCIKLPKIFVGNGGLSLRKIDKFYEFCKNHNNSDNHNEDIYFCYHYKDDFNICPLDISKQFAFDLKPNELLWETQKYPMGCHWYHKNGIEWLLNILNMKW